MARLVGIDLGTANSCMAFVDDRGEDKAIINADGEIPINR